MKRFSRALMRWYTVNGRDLPWRRTRDPYAILVSEFMLQQTQVVTVLPYYKEWLRRFPTLASLAGASENDVLHAWQGLGYYARARNLHSLARILTDRNRGQFPRAIAEMQKLPGIGKYTAHAIATFAYGQAVPIVEANVSRILSRVFDVRESIDSSAGRGVLWSHAARLVPNKSSAEFNSAMLDLGALVCLPRKPTCTVCPLKNLCTAKSPESLPVKRPRPAMKRLVEKHRFVLGKSGILLQSAEHRWRGMWILPQLEQKKRNRPIYQAPFPFTNHQITLQVFGDENRRTNGSGTRWFSRRQLQSIPIPSPHRRAIEELLRTPNFADG